MYIKPIMISEFSSALLKYHKYDLTTVQTRYEVIGSCIGNSNEKVAYSPSGIDRLRSQQRLALSWQYIAGWASMPQFQK